MSITTMAQPWLLLPTRMISPLRTYQSTPRRVAHRGDPQADRLDHAGRLAEVDRVAHAVLVLQQHEQAGDQVLDQALRAEAERHADDAGAGQQRRQVEAELAQHQQRRRS